MTEAERLSPHREWGLALAAETSMSTNFFDQGSPYLDHPLLTEERSSLEVDRLLALVGRDPGAVLDMGCGFGRHCAEFARRGVRATGVDPSLTMIAAARDRARSAGVDVEFVAGRGETFSRPSSFDLAICLFTSLGQVSSDLGEDSPTLVLENINRSLRPGGMLVVEVPERTRTVDAFVVREQLGPTQVTRWFDDATSQMHERFVTPTRQFELAFRVFDADELATLMENAGFVVRERVGHALVSPPDTFMTLVAECPPG